MCIYLHLYVLRVSGVLRTPYKYLVNLNRWKIHFTCIIRLVHVCGDRRSPQTHSLHKKLIMNAIFTWCVSMGIDDPHGRARCTEINFPYNIALVHVCNLIWTLYKCLVNFNCAKINWACNIYMLHVCGDRRSPRMHSLHKNKFFAPSPLVARPWESTKIPQDLVAV